MLNQALKYNYSAFLILMFALLLKVVLYYSHQVYNSEYDASIIRLFDSPSLWSGMFAALMSVLIGLLLLINSERFAKRTDFSLWIVLLFVLQMNFYSSFSFSPEYVGLFFFVVSLYYFFKGTSVIDKKTTLDCFNLSFSLAIGCYFTPHLVYLLPLFWLGRIIAGQAHIKSFLASLLGFIIPFFIVDAIIYVFYSDVAAYTSVYLLHQLQIHESVFVCLPRSWSQLANIGPMILLVISIIVSFADAMSSKIVIRKYNQMNVLVLLYILVMIIIGLVPLHFGMLLIFAPASYFYSNFQCLNTKRWRNVFLGIFVLSALLSYPVIMDGIIAFFNVFFGAM